MKRYLPFVLAFFIAVFGILTLYLSGSIILDLFGVREEQGNYVPFVIWANFISSITYLLASYGLITHKEWITKILGLSIIVLIISWVGFYFHVQSGGLYLAKTTYAIPFRIGVTSIFVFLSWLIMRNSK